MNNFKLTGGTFFTLLSNALDKSTKKNIQSNGFDSFSDINLLEQLKNLTSQNYEKNLKIKNKVTKTVCSNFKNCNKEATSNYLNLSEDSDLVIDFNNAMKTDIGSMLEKTNLLIDNWFYNKNKLKNLANALLKLIEYDNSIQSTSMFYINSNNNLISKDELLALDSICLSNLILSCWNYIISSKINNTSGRETIEFWKTNLGKIKWDEWKPVDIELTLKAKLNFETKTNITTTQTNEILDKQYCSNFFEYNFDLEFNKAKKVLKKYSTYYKKSCSNLLTINSTLYEISNIDFYQIYVAPDLKEKNINNTKTLSGSEAWPYNYISTFGRYTCITGGAGYGKSSFLKHLFLCEFVNNPTVVTNLVPIYIESRCYNSNNNIENLLFESISQYCTIKYDEFIKDLESGGFLLLFDGLDEINTGEMCSFYIKLEQFCHKFPQNFYVTSYRPLETYGNINKFHEVEISGLSSNRAIKLVKKLIEVTNSNSIDANKFIFSLEDYAYHDSTSGIIKNPLLITLMFLSFSKAQKLPSDNYEFFSMSFDYLFDKFNKNYNSYKLKLNKFNYKKLLAEFSFYVSNNQQYLLDEIEINDILSQTSFKDIDVDLFIYDMKNNLNLFHQIYGKYTMIHRSFFDYFTAYYFYLSKTNLSNYKGFIPWIEKMNSQIRVEGDYFIKGNFLWGSNIAMMLKEMDEELFTKNIVKPILQKYISLPISQESYYNFLKCTFLCIDYGLLADCLIYPKLLKYISTVYLKKFEISLTENVIIDYKEYRHNKIFYHKKNGKLYDLVTDSIINYCKETLSTKEFLKENLDFDLNLPNEYNYSIPIEVIFNDPQKFSPILDYLNKDDCSLKIFYNQLIKIMTKFD